MHLKSYQIDGTLLRTGAANFSASGLKRQDNDLVVIETAEAAAAFKRAFDARFASGEIWSRGVTVAERAKLCRSTTMLTALNATWQRLVEIADGSVLRTLRSTLEVVRDQSNNVAKLEACGRRDDLKKRVQQAVLYVRGVGQNQNDSESGCGDKHKAFEKLPKSNPNEDAPKD
jgi:hypothetical protein